MSRIPLLVPEQLSEAQRQVYDGITGGKRSGKSGAGSLTRPDGSLVGPFNVMLHSPEIGQRVQALGEAIRFSNSLPNEVLEIAILMTGREWTAQFEWWAHERLARRAGVDKAIIEAIKERRRPDFTDERQATVYDFSRELLDTRQVSDATYQRTVEVLGQQSVVDLVATLGYYGIVSMVLNSFDVPLPDGEEKPL